nr:hypothetical protein [Tanacetum cinerariifolium]
DKIAQALEITELNSRVKKLERRNKASKLKRLKKVGSAQRINTSDDTVMDEVSNQRMMIADMDADADVVLKEAKDVATDIVKDVQDADIDDSAHDQGRQAKSQTEIYKIDLEHANKVLSMQDEEESEPAELQEVVDVGTTAKIITEVVTATSTTITVADVLIPTAITAAALTLTAAPSRRRKGVVIKDPQETATTTSTIIHSEAKSKDKGKGILTKEQMDEEDSRVLKRLNESKEEKAAKKQKLDMEVEELKRHLQIVPNAEDDVYTEATPLARKVPVIDYEIYNENNKPYYKIKRVDAGYTCSNLEKSKKCSWSSQSQELKAVGIMWCADNYIYNNTVDFTGRKEISTHKVHSGSDAK